MFLLENELRLIEYEKSRAAVINRKLISNYFDNLSIVSVIFLNKKVRRIAGLAS